MFHRRSSRQGGHRATGEARRLRWLLGVMGSSFEAVTGRLNGLATLAGNWPTLMVIQTAALAAGGSERFVKLAVAAQSAGIVVLMIAMLVKRRNIAGRRQLAWSCATAAVGAVVVGLAPNRITLVAGVLVSAWVMYAASSLRTALSPRAGHEEAPHAQGRVQTVMYGTVFVASIMFVAIGRNPTGWRIATGVLAAALALEAVRLALVKDGTLPDPKDAPQPGLDQPARLIFRHWPIVAAMGTVAVQYVMVGLYFTDVQTELHSLGWRVGVTSFMVAAVTGSRVLTLWMSRLMSNLGEEHHGTAMVWSAAVVVAGAGLAAWPLLGGDVLAATVAVCAAGVMLQGAMNGSNPVIRGYIGNRSADASTLVNVGAAAGQFAGAQVAAFIPWRDVATGWGVCAVVIFGLAVWTTLHRYQPHQYDNTQEPPRPPHLPSASVDWLWLTESKPGRSRLSIRAGAWAPLPDGYAPWPDRDVGPGEKITLTVPFDSTVREQYWQSAVRIKMTSLSKAPELAAWLRSRRHPLSWMSPRAPSQYTSEQRTPLLVLTGERPQDCFTYDQDADRWVLNTQRARPVPGVLATGTGGRYRRIPLVYTDRRVRGKISGAGVARWQVADVLGRPSGPVTTTTLPLPVREITDPDKRRNAGGRWLVPVAALDGVTTQIVTALEYVTPRPPAYVEAKARHT